MSSRCAVTGIGASVRTLWLSAKGLMMTAQASRNVRTGNLQRMPR